LIEVFGAGDGGRTCDGIYDALNDAVLEALDAGLIDRAGYEAYYQPVYFRTLEELTAPVTAPDAPLASLLRLERAEKYEVAVPFVEAFRRTGDPAAFARSYTDFFRAFTEPVLRAASPDIDQLADDVFARAERLIRDHPERYEFHWVSVAALLIRLARAAHAERGFTPARCQGTIRRAPARRCTGSPRVARRPPALRHGAASCVRRAAGHRRRPRADHA
jgi:hypothetical protein